MRVEDMILVSVDDHIIEPPDVFVNHLPKRWLDEAPKVVSRENGSDVWVFEGADIPNFGLSAVVGKPREEYGVDPTSYDDMRAGCFDVHARVADMSANGVLGSMCFPSFTGFAGKLFNQAADKELALALVRAYNDWHIDEWCGAYPDRFIPMALVPLWDPELMAQEVRRVAAKGCHSIAFNENPSHTGFPSLHQDHWDPFWEACVEQDTVVSMHTGSSSRPTIWSLDAPIDAMITIQPSAIVQSANDILWSRVPRKYPTLKMALSEGEIGWIPYLLERADRTYDKHRAWTHQDFGELLPSEVFRRQIITCFIHDRVGVEMRHRIGIDNITWECDYPHSDTTWPDSPENLYSILGGVPDDEIDKITHANAMRLFHYDPFSIRPRERCTVGALRAEAADVDTRPVPGKRHRDQAGTNIGGLLSNVGAQQLVHDE